MSGNSTANAVSAIPLLRDVVTTLMYAVMWLIVCGAPITMIWFRDRKLAVAYVQYMKRLHCSICKFMYYKMKESLYAVLSAIAIRPRDTTKTLWKSRGNLANWDTWMIVGLGFIVVSRMAPAVELSVTYLTLPLQFLQNDIYFGVLLLLFSTICHFISKNKLFHMARRTVHWFVGEICPNSGLYLVWLQRIAPLDGTTGYLACRGGVLKFFRSLTLKINTKFAFAGAAFVVVWIVIGSGDIADRVIVGGFGGMVFIVLAALPEGYWYPVSRNTAVGCARLCNARGRARGRNHLTINNMIPLEVLVHGPITLVRQRTTLYVIWHCDYPPREPESRNDYTRVDYLPNDVSVNRRVEEIVARNYDWLSPWLLINHQRIVVTGYGIGGACALLCYARLKKYSTRPTNQVEVYTFGAPIVAKAAVSTGYRWWNLTAKQSEPLRFSKESRWNLPAVFDRVYNFILEDDTQPLQLIRRLNNNNSEGDYLPVGNFYCLEKTPIEGKYTVVSEGNPMNILMRGVECRHLPADTDTTTAGLYTPQITKQDYVDACTSVVDDARLPS